MVDLDGYFEEQEAVPRYERISDKEEIRKTLMTNEDCRPSSADGACAFCKDQKRQDHEGKTGLVALFDDYNFIVPEDHDELSSHKYLLCPADIKAFVFKTRVWGTCLLTTRRAHIAKGPILTENRNRPCSKLVRTRVRGEHDRWACYGQGEENNAHVAGQELWTAEQARRGNVQGNVER